MEFQARFIGLPGTLKLKRDTKPDESGSNAFVAVPPAVNGWATETKQVTSKFLTQASDTMHVYSRPVTVG